jgi:hypothetical protein
MQLLPFLLRTTPPSFRRWMIDYLPLPDLRLARDLVDIMDRNSRRILEKKREAISKGDSAVLEQIGQGKDIMSLLSMFDYFDQPTSDCPSLVSEGQR